MSARASVAAFWDDLTREWLSGGHPMPDPLPRWFDGYQGRGRGAVTRQAFAEPWIGPLLGTPRVVVLGLNPGHAHFAFQARDGLFAREIEEFGGFTAWAASEPYSRPPWTDTLGRNRFHDQRAMFGQRL